MITPSQKNEIQKFLLTKRLPIKVLLEVKDHFICQINQLMTKQEMGFQEAFLNTKSAWDKDLSRKKLGFLWLTKAPAIVRSYQLKKNHRILTFSLLVALLYIIIQIALSFVFASKHNYIFASAGLYGGFMLVMPQLTVALYLVSKLAVSFSDQRRSFYQLKIPLLFFTIGVAIYIFMYFSKLPTNSFKIIHQYLQFDEYGLWTFLWAIGKLTSTIFIWTYLFRITWSRCREYFRLKKIWVG